MAHISEWSPGRKPSAVERVRSKWVSLSGQVILALLKATYARWNDDKGPRLGAALAYYTLLSLAPLLLIAVAVAGLVFGKQAAQGAVGTQIEDLIGTGAAQAVHAMLRSTHGPAAGAIASIAGVITVLLGASGVFAELRDALNTIWGVAQQNQGLWRLIKDRALSFLMVLGIGFLLLLSLLSSTAVTAAGKYVGDMLPASELVLEVVNFLVSFIVTTVLFAMIFKILPDRPIRWSDVWVGAAVTALLFDTGKFAIGLYLVETSLASAYGAAGSLVLILVWTYYSAQIFYFGAEFTRVFAETRASRVGNQTS